MMGLGSCLRCDYPGCKAEVDLETNFRNPPADGVIGLARARRAGWEAEGGFGSAHFCPDHRVGKPHD